MEVHVILFTAITILGIITSDPNTLIYNNEINDTIIVNITAYTNSPSETEGNPNITASGSTVKVGGVAASRDIIKKYGYGTKIFIKALNKTYEITDTMSSRWKNKIDIFMYDRNKALQFGLKKKKEIYILKRE